MYNRPRYYRQDVREPEAKLFKPKIVGYMSVSGISREYHSDLSEMKFVTDIPAGNVSWDLNHNIDSAIKRSRLKNVEKINNLLKFLLEHGHRFNFPQETILSYRYTYIAIIAKGIGDVVNPVIIRATLFKNNIYLCYIYTDEQVEYEINPDEMQKKRCAWGYKFEQYMSSDLPSLTPVINTPVNENNEFSLYYCSQIGDHKLFYGAQTDGLLATDGTVQNPPETNDFNEIVNYLRNNCFVELKTQKIINDPKEDRKFRKFKLLTSWCQCYLADLKGLLVGFRDDDGMIKNVKWFDTAEIPKYCEAHWNPQVGLNFLNYFLNFVKKSLHDYKTIESDRKYPLTLEFSITPNKDISVIEVHEKEKMILPDWFINA